MTYEAIKKIKTSFLRSSYILGSLFMLNGCSVPGFNVSTQTHTSTYTSYYGQSIECLGLMLPPEKVYKYTGLIASFLDKTGKGSITTAKPITQGAADLAADSLAKFKYFKIKTAIPHNFRDNPQIFEFNKQGTDFFVHGSIVILDSTHDQKSISIAVNPVNFNHKVTRVVAIVHMSVNSSLDNTVFINDGGDLASGNFKAEWNIFQNDAGLFRLIGKKAINLSGSIQIQQAADLALHEAIELGLVNLVGRMFDLPYKRCLPRQDNDFSNVSSEIARLSYGRTPYRPATAKQNHHAPQQQQSSQPHPNNAHHGQQQSHNAHQRQQHSNNPHHGQSHSSSAHHRQQQTNNSHHGQHSSKTHHGKKHSKYVPLSVESQPLEPLK